MWTQQCNNLCKFILGIQISRVSGCWRLGNGADNIQMGIYFTILLVTGGSSFARKNIYQGSSHARGKRGGGGHSHICPVQVCAMIKTPFLF